MSDLGRSEQALRTNHPTNRDAKAETWRAFVSYRQSDGRPVAEKLYRSLHGTEIEFEAGRRRAELSVYWDKRAPGVSNYRSVLDPWLRSSRALIFVVSKEALARRAGIDHLHRELEWWEKHRRVAPILIDAFGLGLDFVPPGIRSRWPKAQVIDAAEAFNFDALAESREERWRSIVEQIRDGIRISETGIRFQELEQARAQNRRLFASLVVVLVLAFVIWFQKGRIANALEESEQRRVVADIAASDLQIKQRDFHSAQERLAGISESRRDFEWGQLWLHVDPSRSSFSVQPAIPTAIALRSTGPLALVGEASGRVALWNVETGELASILGHHPIRIAGVAFGADGRTAISADRSGTIRIWRLEDASYREFPLHSGPISSIELSSDGTQLLTSDDSGTIRLSRLDGMDLFATEKPVRIAGDLTALAADGSAIAAIDRMGVVRVQHLVTNVIAVMDRPVGEAAAIVFSGATNRIAVADLRGLISLFDVEREKEIGGYRPFSPEDSGAHILSLERSQDGRLLFAGCSDGAVRIWDLPANSSIGMLPGFATSISALSISDDPTRFVACDDHGNVRLYELDPFRLAAGYYELASDLQCFAVDSSGRSIVVSTEDGSLLRFSDESPEPEMSVSRLGDRIDFLRFCRENTCVIGVTNRGGLEVLDAATGQSIWEFSLSDAQITCATEDPSSKNLLFATTHGMIEPNNSVYRLSEVTKDQPPIPILENLPPIQVLEIAPDGRLAAVGTCGSVGLDESDRIPSKVVVFDVADGSLQWQVEVEASVESLRFLVDRGWLAIGAESGRVELRDLDDGGVVRVLTGHTAGVRSIDVNRRETRLVTASVDGTARLWDLELGVELLVLQRGEPVMTGVRFAKDDQRIIVGNHSQRLGFWNSFR